MWGALALLTGNDVTVHNVHNIKSKEYLRCKYEYTSVCVCVCVHNLDARSPCRKNYFSVKPNNCWHSVDNLFHERNVCWHSLGNLIHEPNTCWQ